MTQEEKSLLLKDLCARLPYGVKAKITEEGVLSYDSETGIIVGKENVDNEVFILQCKNDSWCLTAINEFVPYLRPMSSMTEEEKNEWVRLRVDVDKYIVGYEVVVDFYNRNHLDYRGLIMDDLAIEAPEGMYN